MSDTRHHVRAGRRLATEDGKERWFPRPTSLWHEGCPCEKCAGGSPYRALVGLPKTRLKRMSIMRVAANRRAREARSLSAWRRYLRFG